jgi:hypothetical protein
VVAVNASSILCNGGMSNVVVSASSGTQPYSGTGSFTELAGVHTYTVTDANTCSGTASVNIIEPAALVAGTSSVLNATCGLSNGSVSMNNASGGTMPYQYSLNNGSFTSNPLFSNLPAGNYSVIVKDANACTTSANGIILTTSAPVNINAIATDASCFDAANGSISIIATGGTGALVYQVGTATSSNSFFNNLSANTYLVTVTDAMNCSASSSVTVSQPAALNIGSISGNMSPLEQSNEWYSVSNTAGINYQWTVIGGSIVSGQNSDSISVSWGTNGVGAIQVIGQNPVGCVDTNAVAISILSTVGIASNNQSGLSLQVLPNPNQGSFELKLMNMSQDKLMINVTDMLGQLVLSKEVSGVGGMKKIEVNGLSKGIYLASVKQNNQIITQKIVVE